MRKNTGFTLVELLVTIVIIGVITAMVANQISKKPIENARDGVRKTDINAIAGAYTIKAIDRNKYEPLIASDIGSGKIPTPPEGGQYQGLLTEPQEYFFICAQLEKGKDLNCLINSENINCYCKKSHITGGPIPTPTPAPSFSPTPSPSGIGTTTPGPSPTFSPTPSPSGIGTTTPGPSPSLTPTPTPSASNPPAVYSDICPYQNIPQTRPETVSLEGIDGSWCYDSDHDYYSSGYLPAVRTPGFCVDNNHNCADFCENNYPEDAVRDGYCTGNWWGAFWTNVHCEFGGYVCTSWGENCNEGNNQAYCDPNAASLPSPTPLPQSIATKRVFKTSTTYTGNLGGLSGADNKCQSRASAAGLSGTWKAWLSDGTASADSRLNHFNGPYTLLDGTVVADNWTDLTDNTLDRNINMTEFKVIDSNLSNVWTGTNPQGGSTGKNCVNWTVSFGWPYFGGVGSGNSTLSYWTQGASDQAYCSSNYLSLYCFEQ